MKEKSFFTLWIYGRLHCSCLFGELVALQMFLDSNFLWSQIPMIKDDGFLIQPYLEGHNSDILLFVLKS